MTIAVYVAAVATEQAIEAISKQEGIKRTSLGLQAICFANPWQSPERRPIWGNKKDRPACFRECKPVDESWRHVVKNVAREYEVEFPVRPTLAESILALFEMTENMPSKQKREWESAQKK